MIKSMEKTGTMRDCGKSLLAIRDTLEIFGGKWKIPIIGALIGLKEARFADLERILINISPRMLSKELKELEMNQLITREIENTRPVTILYKITPYGESCKYMLNEMEQWGVKHRQKIIGKK